MPRYWRITSQRGRKAHLTKFEPGKGSGDVALCGKALPENTRKGSATTINEPIGNECEQCLKKSGYLKNPPLTLEQRQLRATVNAVRHLVENFGLKGTDVVEVFEAARRLDLTK
jgi:hypothetical protein